jgi:hypothetical protein
MDVFRSSRGRVAAIDSPGIPMSLYIESWGGFPIFKSIVTSIRVGQQGGVQFLHTLRDFIYIYVFGDRIGTMSITGLSFWDKCDAPGYHGIEYVNGYYLDNRVSQRAAPLTVVIGSGTSFLGFLVGFNFDFNNPDDLIAQFCLELRVVPEASDLG